ncbi:MAG: class I SAM-dependent methyltransferase [Candidatus Komeilibacteria bacterium]|nr:class I SAM-dependent methyltransferase [Candidatus Komeilibacteria bacterium]
MGGGNSADLWFLAKSNEVYALDASSVGVEQAREHNIKAEFDNVEEALPFAADFFDIVVLKDILEHIYNPFELLQEAKRIVKPSGYIIISLPNHFYLPFRLKILFGQNLIWKTLMHNHKKDFAEWNYMHVRFFTWSGVKKMIKAAGLKITKTYWDFGTLAHYSDPLMYEYAFKANNKKITTRQQQLMYKVLLPAYKIFNLICPRAFRKWLVSLCPGLLCAGFYLRVEK